MDDGALVDTRDSNRNVAPIERAKEETGSDTGRQTEPVERALVTIPRLDLTRVPARGTVPHEIRMEALRERNAEMEFYCYAGIFLIMVLGFLFRGRG